MEDEEGPEIASQSGTLDEYVCGSQSSFETRVFFSFYLIPAPQRAVARGGPRETTH